MAAYSAFLAEVLPLVPDCPVPVAENAVRAAAIEFFERSWAWTTTLSPIAAVAGQAAYPFAPPAGAVVVTVLQVKYDGRRLHARTTDELDDMYPDWSTETGEPEHYTQEDERNIILVPKPAANLADALALKVSLKPSVDSTTIEDRLYEEHRERIAQGALARLFGMTAKPWGDKTERVARHGLFEAAIADVRSRAQKSFVRSRQRVRASFL